MLGSLIRLTDPRYRLVLVWVTPASSSLMGRMSVNAHLLASPHCVPPRSGRRRDTSAWHRISCAQQQSRPRPAHPRWGEAWEERARNHRWQDVWANPGPDTNGLTLHDSRDRDASVRHKSPASTQHTHRVAQSTTVLQRGLITGALSRAQGKLKQPLGPHAGGDTPEAPTSFTDIDTTHAGAQRSGHFDPPKNTISAGSGIVMLPAPRRCELRGPR